MGFNEPFIGDSLPQPREVNLLDCGAAPARNQWPSSRQDGMGQGRILAGCGLTQLKKLSCPCLQRLRVTSYALSTGGGGGKEMSAGGWNSTKPRLKGVSRQSQLGPEAWAGRARRLDDGSGEGAPDQGWAAPPSTANGRSHVDSIDSTLDEALGKAATASCCTPPSTLSIPPTP